MAVVLLKQASEKTGLSEWELSTGAKSGKYPAFRIGGPRGRWAFDLNSLEARIKQLAEQNLIKPEPEVIEFGKIRAIKV